MSAADYRPDQLWVPQVGEYPEVGLTGEPISDALRKHSHLQWASNRLPTSRFITRMEGGRVYYQWAYVDSNGRLTRYQNLGVRDCATRTFERWVRSENAICKTLTSTGLVV